MNWQIEDAEQHLDEVLRRAVEEGPQFIARDGQEIVVFVAAEEYRRVEQVRDADG
jgi:prevent-host-death family protein